MIWKVNLRSHGRIRTHFYVAWNPGPLLIPLDHLRKCLSLQVVGIRLFLVPEYHPTDYLQAAMVKCTFTIKASSSTALTNWSYLVLLIMGQPNIMPIRMWCDVVWSESVQLKTKTKTHNLNQLRPQTSMHSSGLQFPGNTGNRGTS